MLQNTHTEYIKLHFFKLHFCDKKKHGRSTGVFICICFHAFYLKLAACIFLLLVYEQQTQKQQ